MRRIPWWMLWAGWLALAACGSLASATPTAFPSATASLPALIPYRPATLTPTPSPQPYTPPLDAAQGPTPTPFVHRVQEGDTLLGIALQYGVPLEALQEANPALNPNLMPVGATVVIPLSEENPAGLPTPTPVPVAFEPPVCYPQADGGGWCLVAVQNPLSEPVENLTGWLVWGEEETDLLSLTNVLPPGGSTVLLAHWARLPLEGQPQVRLASAFAVAPSAVEERYVKVGVDLRQSEPPQGQALTLRGFLRWSDAAAPQEIWLAAVGFAADGRPAAARRWVFAAQDTSGHLLPFRVRLYSLGPPLVRVELWAEGQR